MADGRWTVDADHPEGWLQPFTPEEQAQHDADQQAWAAAAARDAAAAQTAASVAAALTTRMAKIRQARTALSNGNVFAGLAANEKAILDGLLEDDLYLARLALHLYDAVA